MSGESKNYAQQTNTDMLLQVRNFVKGTTHESKVPSRELVQSGVLLLKTLPATRFAVLEYFSSVYDDTVYNLLSTNEDSLDSEQYVVIDDIQESLLAFVQINPDAWTPIISAWAIELLGQISSKHTSKYLKRKSLGQSASLNEVLQMWMGCRATKSLIEIASECIASMVGDTPDSCVDALLETSVKHSPHFDWVVAHIGLCFPRTIINRVLMCGLKDFCMHGGSQAEIGMVTEEKMPKFASVVGILGHLASQHGREIKIALLALFQESLHDDTKDMYHQVVPFLLRLASMSNMLLKVITTDFISILTLQILNKLADQSVHWFEKGEEDNDGLLNLLVHLLTTSENGTYRLLQLLLDTAYPPQPHEDSMETDQPQCILKPVVQKTSQKVLDMLVTDLSQVVHTKCSSGSVDIPFLKGLQSHTSSVTRMLSHAQGERHKWLCTIVKCLAISSGESQAAKILCDVMVYSKSSQQLPFFITLQEELQIKLQDILENTTQDLFHIINSTSKGEKKIQTLKNLLEVLKWEKNSKESNRVTRCTFRSSVKVHLDSLTNLINHPNYEISSASLEIFNYIDLAKSLPVFNIIKLCHAVVAFFFRILSSSEPKKVEMCSSCRECVQKLCSYPSGQKTLLRLFLENAFTKECLGARKVVSIGQADTELKAPIIGLLEANKSLVGNIGRSAQGGVIGQGLRSKPRPNFIPKDQIQHNKQLYMDLLCCVACAGTPPSKGEDTSIESALISKEQIVLSPHIPRMIALLLIELVTPDVIYNGIPWPEEEFMKVTIERDLLIKKKLEENPILWDIFDFLCVAPGAMCYCSAILRGIMATLLYHWDGNRDKSAKNSPWQFEATCKVIEYMRKGQFLPPPLSYSAELLPYLTPYEVYLVIVNLWRYMKENPPVPEERNWKEMGIDSKFLEVLRPIFHSNIANMGHMYGRFFGS